MAEWRLRRQIDKARSRWRHRSLMFVWASVWLCGAILAGLVCLALRSTTPLFPHMAELVLGAVVMSGTVAAGWLWRATRDRRTIARRIEAAFPELESSLLAALDVVPDAQTGNVGYLQDRVIGQALSHAYQHGWQRLVPLRQLALSHVFHLCALGAFGLALWQLHDSESQQRSLAGSWLQGEQPASGNPFQVSIEPGNTEVERGTSLLVLARFQGQLPPEATLVYELEDQGESADEQASGGQIAMSKALDDPLFGGSVTAVRSPLRYHVEYSGQKSETYRVTVFEYPRLVRADALLKFPHYTSLAEKRVQDFRQVSAVVGTEVTVTLELNKPVKVAQLREMKSGAGRQSNPAADEEASHLDLQPVADRPQQVVVAFPLNRTVRYQLHLEDDRGRQSKEAVELVFTAISNQPPDLKLAAPGRDTQVSPLEELELKAKAFDDFGLRRVGLTYVMAGEPEQELTLAEDVAAKERLELAHIVALEKLAAEPDQLLSYYFWAEDTGPEGEVRRTSSDMFFAEVRPFEEIFRQGQAPAGGQQQQQGSPNATAADKLAELQKEIINATWKLVRREKSDQTSAAFPADLALLVESQNSALQQTEELSERIRDPQSQQRIDDARRHMNRAIQELIRAKDENSPLPLRPALDAEQQAYQALLKLRAREHEVVRSQRSQSSASSGQASSRSQQQLDQLELKDQENRYESERTAQTPEDPAEREMRQVLNRLKELARRQGDLNDRLQELQAALQEAKTEEQREELRRQLKRLQEEQEQILRDTEELQGRMDQPQNMERMADSRQQLDEARERARQSSEALREGMVPQAASAGARAEENFEQLRDDFRKQTSERFQQEVRELSEQARELDEREQQIAEQLRQLQEPTAPTKSLREANERERLMEGLQEQKTRSDQLLDRMRQTIQDAEGPQPLLAEQLYDTVRNVQQKNLGQNLEITREALRRGLFEPARQQEEAARETISELREGIDRAAQSVLEDESEALRRAQGELNDLSRQLNDELARNGQTPPRSGMGAEPETAAEDRRGQQRSNEESAAEKGQPGAEGTPDDGQQPRSDQQGTTPQTESEESDGKAAAEKSSGKGTGKSQGKEGERQSEAQQQSEAQEQGSGKESAAETGRSGEPSDQPGQGSPGSQQPSSSQQPSGSEGKSGEAGAPREPQSAPSGDRQNRRGGSPEGERRDGGFEQLAGPVTGGGNPEMLAPFTGNGFREWSDRLRDVEEMLGDPELSAEAARIRERARALRAESKRHSAPPNWDLVQMEVAEPLAELLDRVHTELLKRTRTDVLVPLDRDPVPPKYSEQVKRYYERLGSGK